MHDRAPRAEDTDWPQILALYGLLEQMTGSPVVTLNRAVAAAMADGPAAGLALLDEVGRPAGRPLPAATPSAPTCWSWPGTPTAAQVHYRPRPAGRRTWPSSVT